MIKLDGAIVVAFHLGLIRVLQYFPRVRKGLLVHGPLLPLGTYAAYGTKVPEVRKAQLSFLAGVQVGQWSETGASMQEYVEKLEFPASNGENGYFTENEPP